MLSGRPLEGIRVLDVSRAVSGPLAGRILSDLGADVVKVELPGADIAQSFGRVTRGRSGLYSQLNVGKRSASLDLRTTEGLAHLIGLTRASDVLVENFRPGVMDGLGAGWPVLADANPGLVMLSISGFGQQGPEADRQAYAPIIHAESGFLGRQAELTGDYPADVAFALADALAGLHGAIAVLAALRLRDRTGSGQHIDMSMLDAMLATDDYTHYRIDRHPVWSARGEAWPAPGGPILISSDRRHVWQQLSRRFGLADPDAHAPQPERLAERARLIADWTASHPNRDQLKAHLEAANLAWAELRTPSDVLQSASVAARDLVLTVTDSDGEERQVIRLPYRFSDADAAPRRGVPETGEHTAEVLQHWLDTDSSG